MNTIASAHLPFLDLTVLIVYLSGMIGMGVWLGRKNRSPEQFMKAGGGLPGWVGGHLDFRHIRQQYQFPGIAGRGIRWQLEPICLQPCDSIACPDCRTILCSILPQERRGFGVSTLGTPLWCLGTHVGGHLLPPNAACTHGHDHVTARLGPSR
jgi:hypothetical protein